MSADSGEGRSRLIVGTKQLLKSIEREEIREIIVARDAESRVTGSLIEAARQKGLQIRFVETMEELGRSCGIQVGAAAAGERKP
ncbi:MAG: ribosomal L7Ae/L30e/S12e/Gadd45 family protein [Christensenellaceae bacterium]|jgi:large subunit ribosomal protein L7A|nr:ribosomal L7Ae/L30e/S12e/Gadd45 family protein [Christensenellaceae bacterium]